MRTKGVRYFIWSLGGLAGLNPLWCGGKDSPEILSVTDGGTAAATLRFCAMSRWLRNLSPAALCGVFALLGGLLGGATAVHGLRPNGYGPTNPPALIAAAGSPGYADSGYANAGYGQSGSSDCGDCSERDLGYRWATLQAITTPDQCPNDSWGFRRGCLDYTGGV